MDGSDGEPRIWSAPLLDAAAILGRVRDVGRHRSLSRYKVNTPVGLLCEVTTIQDLERISAVVRATGVAVLTCGLGANLLIAEGGVDGIVCQLGSFARTKELSPVGDEVLVGGGDRLPGLAKRMAAAGLGGMPWLRGIPGTIGGAMRMNAGVGADMEMKDHVVAGDVFDLATGERRWWSADEFGFGDRRSALADHHVVLGVRLRIDPQPPAEIRAAMRDHMAKRERDQAGMQQARTTGSVLAVAGCGKPLEDAGVKGRRVGGAFVPQAHANFIVADRGATATDVFELSCQLRQIYIKVAEPSDPVRIETSLYGFTSDELARAGASSGGAGAGEAASSPT